MGKPENVDLFNKYLIDGIDVYVLKGLIDNCQGVRISFKDFILKKYLKVDGLRISVV